MTRPVVTGLLVFVHIATQAIAADGVLVGTDVLPLDDGFKVVPLGADPPSDYLADIGGAEVIVRLMRQGDAWHLERVLVEPGSAPFSASYTLSPDEAGLSDDSGQVLVRAVRGGLILLESDPETAAVPDLWIFLSTGE